MMRFLPKHKPPDIKLIRDLSELISQSKRMLVITGAGFSTESGLPDYRSAGVGLYARTDRRPIDYRSFIESDHVRKLYWARNFMGWPYFSSVLPNKGHYILADWSKSTCLSSLITQNVDQLHQRAGTENVLELHGNNHTVVCLNCGFHERRSILQQRLIALNPEWKNSDGFLNDYERVAPDGDMELQPDLIQSFKVPTCSSCGKGLLKPDVVFFGENLPSERKTRAALLISKADLVLCMGTTLQTYSSFRLVLQAKKQNIPIAIVNIGPTRADTLAQLILDARINDVLEHLRGLL